MSARRPILFILALPLLACGPGSAPERPGPAPSAVVVEGISYAAETLIMESFPVGLNTTATLTNTTGEARRVTFPDGCVVLIRAYRDAARSGEPAWDQARAVMCTQALVEADLAPGASVQYRNTARANEILGDSLPAGTYYLTAALRPNGRVVEVPAGQAELSQ